MKKILFIFLFLPIFSKAQKVYNIIATSSTIPIAKNYGVVKIKATITVTDSTFIYDYKGKETVYKMVKKVSNNYFKVTDGLKDYIINIGDTKIFNYKGIIRQETPDGDVNFFYN